MTTNWLLGTLGIVCVRPLVQRMLKSATVSLASPKCKRRSLTRVEAGLGRYLLGLLPGPVPGSHSRTDCAAITLDSNRQDLQPVAAAGQVIALQRGRFIYVPNQDIHVAIIVEVTEGAAAARMQIGDARTPFLD